MNMRWLLSDFLAVRGWANNRTFDNKALTVKLIELGDIDQKVYIFRMDGYIWY